MTPLMQSYERLAATVIKGLERRQMEGFYCPDSASAVAKVLELMPAGSSIAWGGSMTLAQTGIMDAVRKGGYEIIDRDLAKTPDEKIRMYGRIVTADFFLMSTNAITQRGELVNVDGAGNRVGPLCHGPRNVIVVAGMNKVVPDVESGVARVHIQAAPPNCVRLARKTPCAAAGVCGDCHSPDTICCHTVVTRHVFQPGRVKVVLVGESLGF